MSEIIKYNPDSYYSYVEQVKTLDVELLSAEQEIELSKTIEAGVYAEQLLLTEDFGGYDPELLQIVQQEGEIAFKRFSLANLRLVINFAQRYFASRKGKNLSKIDYVQEGNAAMMHAIEKFDYKKGFKFSTYAALWIRQSFDVVAAKQESVSVSIHTIEKVNLLAKAIEELTYELGQEPTITQIAEKMNLKESTLIDVLEASVGPASLNKTVGETDHELGSLLASEYDVQDEVEFRIMTEELERALSNLSPKHEKVIRFRYGIGCRIKTHKAIAKELRVGWETVNILTDEAMTALGEQLNTKSR